jgi:hypothetical protein
MKHCVLGTKPHSPVIMQSRVQIPPSQRPSRPLLLKHGAPLGRGACTH